MATDLDSLERSLDEALEWIRARMNKKDWPEVQQRYGLKPTPIAFGGVTADHVRAVMRLAGRDAAAQLEQLQHTADRGRVTALWDRLCRLAEEEVERHRRGASGRLGQVFVNAAENVDFWREQMAGSKSVIVLLCKTCGAAQEKTRDFRCEYCGGDLFQRQED
jgi:hypothetical protein